MIAPDKDAGLNRIAVIPARSGSKRIPGKNTKSFLGKPMISWPIAALRRSNLFDRVFVSTDSVEIGELSKNCGADVILRDPKLADDYTGTTQVLLDFLAKQIAPEANPWVYLVYATTPTDVSTISKFVGFTEDGKPGLAVSLKSLDLPVQKSFHLDEMGRLVALQPEHLNSRTQDLRPLYLDAGKFYGASRASWEYFGENVFNKARGFVVPSWMSTDIDTEEDWELAELRVQKHLATIEMELS